MPIKDAPQWAMPDACVAAVAEVAPAQRLYMTQLMETLKQHDGVDFNDRFSVVAEVLAAQVNMLADALRARTMERNPEQGKQLSDARLVQIVIGSLEPRCALRKLRGDD